MLVIRVRHESTSCWRACEHIAAVIARTPARRLRTKRLLWYLEPMRKEASNPGARATSENGERTFLTVIEVAHHVGMSVRTMQLRLNKAVAARKDRKSVYVPSRGRTPARYRDDFVAEFLQEQRLDPFTRELRRIATDRSGIRVIGARDEGETHYNGLLLAAILHAHTLCLRGIAGSIFDHGPLGTALSRRRAPTRVLLLNPFCEAARDRAAAADEAFAADRSNRAAYRRTKLWERGVTQALWFLSKNRHLEARWVDEVPSTFLIWTEHLALIEPYDYGREMMPNADGIPSGTLSGKAPLLVIPRRSTYHARLKDGFDRVFNGEIRHLQTRSLAEIEAELAKDDRDVDAQARTAPGGTGLAGRSRHALRRASSERRPSRS